MLDLIFAAVALLAISLSPPVAIGLAVAVIVGVIIVWKMVKVAFKIAVLVAAGAIIWYLLRSAGYL